MNDRTLSLRLSAEEHAKLQAAADKDRRSVSNYLSCLVQEHLAKDEGARLSGAKPSAQAR